MYIKIKVTHFIISIVLVGLLGSAVAWAGSPDSPGAPTDSASQLYTLQQVYDRINNGAAVTKMSSFTEPASGPGSTMVSLDQVYDLAGQRSRPAKTGQSKCYDTGGTEIACAGTGQDGEYQKGVTWPTPRFITSTTGIVTDTLTGLVWLQNANCAGITMNWSRALTEVVELNTAGTMNSNNCGDTSNGGSHQTDWRLPNVRELQSLIHYGYSLPAVSNAAGTGQWTEGDPFYGVQSYYYWSSTSDNLFVGVAWSTHISVGSIERRSESDASYVWPVRGGQ